MSNLLFVKGLVEAAFLNMLSMMAIYDNQTLYKCWSAAIRNISIRTPDIRLVQN